MFQKARLKLTAWYLLIIMLVSVAFSGAIYHVLIQELNRVERVQRLRQERSRRHLSFSSGFEVRVFSADARNKQVAGNAIMGFGAPFVILDEASLVDDTVESKVFRMISGFSTTKHLYMKVGNPFYRNHFLKSHNDPDFHLVHFDYHRGIEEGRFTQEIIEKARSKPGFGVLFEVKFPDASAIDERGWSLLLTDEDIEASFVDKGSGFGFLKVGGDPSGEGTNFNTLVGRYRNYAHIILKERILDQWMFTAKAVQFKNELKRQERMLPMGWWIDRVGIGEGYYQTMRMDLENVYGVNVGMTAQNPEEFVNLRAEAFWRLRADIKARKIQLERNEDWFQLSKIKYCTRLEGKRGKIQIMSKEEMAANGVQSPDVADALMLTYVTLDPFETISPDFLPLRQEASFDRYVPFNEI